MPQSVSISRRLPLANYLYRNGKYHEALAEYKKIAIDKPTLARPIGRLIRETTRRLDKNLTLKPQRAAIFAGYSICGVIEDYVLRYLKELQMYCSHIIYVCDNCLDQSEQAKIQETADIVISGHHGEYDFGSYKRGLAFLAQNGILPSLDWIILCNDSCYGPVKSFEETFKRMEHLDVDFWGISKNEWPELHLQSYFLSFSFQAFSNQNFRNFFTRVNKKTDVSEVILSYETKLTGILAAQGLTWGCATDINSFCSESSNLIDQNPTLHPLLMLQAGSPLVKVKAFAKPQCNHDGMFPVLKYLNNINPVIVADIASHRQDMGLLSMKEPSFTVILPSRNRARMLPKALDSVFRQNYEGDFEIILIDDGSTDDTERAILDLYKKQLHNGQLQYIRLEQNCGVASARNQGLRKAKYDWIAYLDSDNQMATNFFKVYSTAIACHPEAVMFYARFKNMLSGSIGGREFDHNKLRRGNFIDIGTFVHKNLGPDEGPFHDHRLRRLVDWEFILSFCEMSKPVYIPMTTLLYSDDDHARISNTMPYEESLRYIQRKHAIPPKVTTIVLAYNHQDFLAECLASVCEQHGEFEHEIIFADDCSSDNTWNVFLNQNKKYGRRMVGIRRPHNFGQAKNLIKALERATGDYIAIIEGDDYWSDNLKLHTQISFLNEHLDCSMVFSKISVLSSETGRIRFLNRQDRLTKNKLTGQDFLDHPSMNLIANFSSCMYRASVLRQLPVDLIDGRLNEIAAAFFSETKGLIGYIPKSMSVYRQHSGGLWTGATRQAQLEMAIQSRQQVKALSDNKWHVQIDREIQRLQSELSASAVIGNNP